MGHCISLLIQGHITKFAEQQKYCEAYGGTHNS